MGNGNPLSRIQYVAAGLLLVTVTAGCQSGLGLKPDLDKLAFWKKDELKLASRGNDLPPPSAHFNPESMGGKNGEVDKQQLQESVNAIVAEAKRHQNSSTEPGRKPYSLDSVQAKPRIPNDSGDSSSSSQSSNGFVLRKGLDKIQTATNDTLARTEQVIKNTGNVVEDSTNSLTDWKNDFQARSERTVAAASNTLKSTKDNVVDSATTAVNSLASTAQDTIDSSVSTVQEAVDNSFAPRDSKHTVSNPYAGKSKKPGGATEHLAVVKDRSIAESKTPAATIQQSSFDSVGSVGSPLQPVQAAESKVNAAAESDESAKSAGSAGGGYPSTPYGEFRPRSATGSTSSASSSATGSPSIPPQLLRGDSSWSPGSTATLRPVGESR